MNTVSKRLSKSFKAFFDSEKASGIILIICTIVSLLVANSSLGINYIEFWKNYVGGLSIEHWINDGLMAIFFLLIGLELKRELLVGELSNFKTALLPMVAALGGVAVPALIHFSLNSGTPTQAGIGIPMATDIAFALGVLALLGDRVPASLKVLVVALAVIDDLCAIIVIAVFYTAQLSVWYLLGALAIWVILYICNRFLRLHFLILYLLGGILMWFLMLKSGVHATIAGVLLAFAIPFSAKDDDEESLSYKLENFLHLPVSFGILPIFALANTGIIIGSDWAQNLASANSLGIMLGLFVGKPIGITLACYSSTAIGFCKIPLDLNWKHVLGAGILGGIGFTMSIFITNLAFSGNANMIDSSKISILLASASAGIAGFLWLKLLGQPEESDEDMETMDFEATEV
ncbi:MAG: Na+/H+ antiporter NhaA [Pyrinomonadaceae bacterium]|nr:Na+/H+ antiporter NhaA [Pyrinomonadaceae bacterium]